MNPKPFIMKRKLSYTACFITVLMTILYCKGNEQKKESPHAAKPAYYNEQYRPQFHFSPPAKWMNDPNGLVFLDGE